MRASPHEPPGGIFGPFTFPCCASSYPASLRIPVLFAESRGYAVRRAATMSTAMGTLIALRDGRPVERALSIAGHRVLPAPPKFSPRDNVPADGSETAADRRFQSRTRCPMARARHPGRTVAE